MFLTTDLAINEETLMKSVSATLASITLIVGLAQGEPTRLNEVQVIGSHNSYKLGIEPKLAGLMALTSEDAVRSLDYSHLPLTDQLNLGLRNLELDVYADPIGGMYADPLGHRLLRSAGQQPMPRENASDLQTPGFKVLHDADFDFRSSCYDLRTCLGELREWSARNPDHPIIVVTINPKTGVRDLPGASSVAPFTTAALNELDRTIVEAMGRHRVLTPDDVRGEAPTLEAAILANGWPTLGEVFGKFLFVWDTGGSLRSLYLRDRPTLENRTMFVNVAPGDPAAAFMIINDPIKDHDLIREMVAKGYMVRTRSDAGTREARQNTFARFEAAKTSGAHVITTDYYIPDRRISDSFRIRFDDGTFSRANPVSTLAAAPERDPAPTAGDRDDAGVVVFDIRDESGNHIPVRLTFLSEDGGIEDLFPNHLADPEKYAVRENVVYSLDGFGAITAPPGTYDVFVSRGLEYSVAKARVTVAPGQRTTILESITREIDTSGWVSGDYHLHTLTYSGHGDSNMPERIISLVGEGVEFAVATDHNHNTDYQPEIDRLGATNLLSTVVGNEVSTPVGHFNAFPLDPSRPIPNHRLPSAVPLFQIIRNETNEYGITPVIQLNHPRWGGIDYFNQAGLDHVTGTSDSDLYSPDFDTIEIFNENEGYGYYDPATHLWASGSQTHSVLIDWFNLLNRGNRYAAVGNSDSHTVRSELAGVPRNYTPSQTDDPAKIDPREVAKHLRANRVFTTSGPFVEFSVNGVPMGGDAEAIDDTGTVEIDMKVQAASWIDLDRVKIVVNGDVVETISVPDIRTPVRLDTTVSISVTEDSWICLLAEGDDGMAPVIHDQSRPIRPLCVTNPVWLDADADGSWVSPFDRARLRLSQEGSPWMLIKDVQAKHPAERLMLAQAVTQETRLGSMVILGLLNDADRRVRLAAAGTAATLGSAELIKPLRKMFDTAEDDQVSVAALKALVSCGVPDAQDLFLEALKRPAKGSRASLASMLDLAEGDFIRDWSVVGYFPNPDPANIEGTSYGPEADPDAHSYTRAKAGSAGWQEVTADSRGYIDLARIDPANKDQSISYAKATVKSPDAREVVYTFGSDDGAVVFLNGEKIYVDASQHGPDPLQHVGVLGLRAGLNEILVKVENGGGGHGFMFRILDEAVLPIARVGSHDGR